MSDGSRVGNAVRSAAKLAVILVLPALPCAARPVSIAATPVSRLDTPWWRLRFDEKQAALRRGPGDLLWFGDSITQNWEYAGPQAWREFAPVWQRFYGDRHAINLGFRGDSTCHLLWRLQHGELEGVRPKAVILLIGANNFGHVHTDANQTYDGIVAVLDVIHRHLPRTQVLLIGVLPSIRSSWVSMNTRLLNRRLADLPAASAWLHYVDASGIFEHDGRVDPSRFLDPLLTPPEPPLHPTAAAQAALAVMIEPVVARMMGDDPHH